MDLSDESAAQLIEFLYELADALERHYAGSPTGIDPEAETHVS